jgi:hypothetical protein
MKAIARLIYTNFTGTVLLRVITTAGLVAGIGGAALNLYLPPLTGGSGGQSRFSLAQESFIFLLPVAGLLCFVFGASLLPALFARLASSHYLYVLPHGRTKLLASAFATVALTALFAAGIVTMYYYKTPLALDLIFQRAIAVSFVTASFLYVVLWLTGKSGTIGLLVGSFVMVATLVLPLRFIASPSTSLALPWTACGVLWGVFTTCFLLAPRLKAPLGRLRQTLAQLTGSTYRGGGEIDFLIGTARPWTLAAGQIVPIAIATYVMRAWRRGRRSLGCFSSRSSASRRAPSQASPRRAAARFGCARTGRARSSSVTSKTPSGATTATRSGCCSCCSSRSAIRWPSRPACLRSAWGCSHSAPRSARTSGSS